MKSNKKRNINGQKTNYTPIPAFRMCVLVFLSSMLCSFNSFFSFAMCFDFFSNVISLWLFAITAWLSVASVLFCYGIGFDCLFLCWCCLSNIFHSFRFFQFQFYLFTSFCFFRSCSTRCFAECAIGFTGRFAHCLVIFHGNCDSVFVHM